MLLGYARDGVDMDALTRTTTSYLCAYLGVEEGSEDAEGIQVTTAQEIIDQVNATMASFQVMMTAVASISLLVGGIGIMNMMLTNVTERIREIGLRKALGARSSDITAQFLIESVTLCLIGGIIGTIVGFLGAFALTSAASSFTYGDAAGIQITPVLDIQSILLAAGTCIAIGIIFGYSPARRAARLNPVDSLHYQ
jgi:ABC-type antimicrobial peptide transport system permease subunit